jgi:hypothetical protein
LRLIECAAPMTCCGSKFHWPGIQLLIAHVKVIADIVRAPGSSRPR